MPKSLLSEKEKHGWEVIGGWMKNSVHYTADKRSQKNEKENIAPIP